LGALANLDELSLETNALTGTIPAQLFDATSLTRLDLDNNQLQGSLPSTIGKLTQLEILEMNENSLVGALPTEIGLLNELGTCYIFLFYHVQHLSTHKLTLLH
jgi:Leucine-rich repeat (LRR) protein